jgi:hypothetical protein
MRSGIFCGRAIVVSMVAASIVNAWSAEPGSEQDLCDPALAAPVPDSELQTERGQADVRLMRSDVDVDANVDGNQTIGSPTGDNAISDSALLDAHGFTTVIQNTGNHVVIQDVTIINVTIE